MQSRQCNMSKDSDQPAEFPYPQDTIKVHFECSGKTLVEWKGEELQQ